MNINYDEIITKANARKNALQALAAQIPEIEQQRIKLYEALDFFATLQLLTSNIDQEGRMILGGGNDVLAARFIAVGITCRNFKGGCMSISTPNQPYYGSIDALLGAL